MTDMPTPKPPVNLDQTMSEGESPFAEEQAWRFCLRCQAALVETPFAEPACLDCQLQYDPKNPATYRTERAIDRLKFWLPGFLLAVASGVISYAIGLQAGELGMALFIAVPVSFGAVLGYAVRSRWIFLALLLIATVAGVVVAAVSLSLAGFFCGASGVSLCLWSPRRGVLILVAG